ncbi:hypothetical protein H0H93_014630 [Arthromyces matolae]|nr:hypothetical protein H0H93_014630 [Arthromyces matolae]
MKRHLLPDAALVAIIFCLLAISHASPIPLERLVPQEDSPSLAASTSLSIRDDPLAIIASRANEGESSMTQDLLKHGGNTQSTRLVLPPLRPERPHPKTQAVVAVIETHAKTEIPETLTGMQADLVLQVLASTTVHNQLPWNTQKPYRWSSQTKQNLIQFYGHDLPSNPQDGKALDATMADLWAMILAARGPPIEEWAIDNRARERLLEGNIDPRGGETRSSLLARAVEEGNEPWKTATNWEAAEREEKWGGQVWKWTKADLKKILAYALDVE